MGIELESALSCYLDFVQQSFARAREQKAHRERLAVLRSRDQELNSLVEEVEDTDQFERLVKTTADLFTTCSSRRTSSKWKSPVRNFFRRSGLYQDAIAQKTTDTNSVFNQYRDAFGRTEIRVTYFAPLEFVSFAEEHMDFGDFQIWRFSKDELDQKLKQATYPIFYPWTTIDTRLLAQYWLLVCSERRPAPVPGSSFIKLDRQVKHKYSTFPGPVEAALRRLVLFRWDTRPLPINPPDRNDSEYWPGPTVFSVPFSIVVSDALIDHPTAMPDTGSLVTVPVEAPQTGEYLGEQPAQGIYLHQEINPSFGSFTEFARQTDAALKTISNLPPWRFMDIAVGFLVKAFFSEGMEQVLWHITAVESALGEKGEQVTNRLKGRIERILGPSEATLFGDLYDFRCDLVHGKKELLKNRVNVAHLIQAREIARRVTLWMMGYLRHIAEISSKNPPSRKTILDALDGNPQNLPAVACLLRCLPSGFPRVPEWYDS